MLVDALLHTHGSMTYRAVGGDGWTLTDHLLALVYDELAIANWQRSKDGAKGRNRPKPLSPLSRKGRGSKIGKTDKSPEQVKALLARYGPAPGAPAKPKGDPSPAELQRRVEDLSLAVAARVDEPGG